jgi:HlyD family secretion protein
MKSSASFFALAVGIGAVVLTGWWLTRDDEAEQAGGGRPPYVLPVTLGTVQRQDLTPRVRLTGTVASERHARLGFDVSGRLRELEVREGDDVEKGEVLARLWDLDQQAVLARAKAAELLAQRELERDLAGSREEQILRLEAELQAAQADAEFAQSEVERNKDLVGTNVISKSRFQTLASAEAAAAARVRAAEERLREAQAGTRAEDIEVRRAELAMATAQVGIAQREVDKTELVAPFSGSVVRRLATVGDTVAAGAPIYEVVDLSRREIELEVPSRVVPGLGEHPPVVVTLDDRPNLRLATRIDSLVSAADEASGNFRGLVRIGPEQDPERDLKPGLFVRTEVELAPLRGALVVPSDAVRVMTEGRIVVRAAPGEQPQSLVAQWVPVRVLGSEGGWTAVEPLGGELAEGDSIVVTGVDLAFPGAPLLPRPPATGAEAGAGAPGPEGAPSTGGDEESP